jgi:YD repeat-containing protein
MRSAVLAVFLFGCDAAGTPCMGDLEGTCARDGVHCVPTWTQAADAATWCPGGPVTNARTALQPCIGYRVLVATVGTTNPPSTVWYYYDADGGLIGTTTRDDQFVQHCLAGKQTFRAPDDCASSQSPHCCRLDFGPELVCKSDAGGLKDSASE